MTIRALTLALALWALPTPSSAEVWQCNGGIFTDEPSAYAGCQPVDSSTVCGSGGNKYFSPTPPGIRHTVERCSSGGESSSPLVNLTLARWWEENGPTRKTVAFGAPPLRDRKQPAIDAIDLAEIPRLVVCLTGVLENREGSSDCLAKLFSGPASSRK